MYFRLFSLCSFLNCTPSGSIEFCIFATFVLYKGSNYRKIPSWLSFIHKKGNNSVKVHQITENDTEHAKRITSTSRPQHISSLYEEGEMLNYKFIH